jgi:hypothetical protein
MRLLPRFFLLLGLTAACGLLIYAAGLIGRATPATIIAGRERDSALNPMDILLIDYSRGLSIQRRIQIPFAIRANWRVSPPQVLARVANGESVIFQLSALNFSRLRLETLLTHHVPAHPRPRDLESAFSGQRAVLYFPTAGEISLFENGTVIQQGIKITENSSEMMLAWSPDGTRLAVKDFRSRQLALLDGDAVKQIDVFRDAAPVWLADSRAILLVQDSFVGRNGRILIIDAQTGEPHPHTAALSGRSAAACDNRLLGYVYIRPDRDVNIQVLELASGQTNTVLNAGSADTEDIFWLGFAPREACDWMLLEMRHPNAVESRFYALHIPSGDMTYLGDNVRILDIGPDAVIYESTTARTAFTVRRAAFDVGAEPEILGRVPAQYQTILWMNGYRRGIFLRDGQLWSIDLTTGTTPVLTLPARLQDIQLVPQE